MIIKIVLAIIIIVIIEIIKDKGDDADIIHSNTHVSWKLPT